MSNVDMLEIIIKDNWTNANDDMLAVLEAVADLFDIKIEEKENV